MLFGSLTLFTIHNAYMLKRDPLYVPSYLSLLERERNFRQDKYEYYKTLLESDDNQMMSLEELARMKPEEIRRKHTEERSKLLEGVLDEVETFRRPLELLP